jgi:heme-degrading monooxygenase HmoA
MTVTELALLHFFPGVVLDDTLLEHLRLANISVEKLTGYNCHYYTQSEDPSFLYIIGEWESVSQHIKEWIPSKENQAVMELLADKVEVVWMYHLDVQPNNLPLGDPVVAVTRHFVPTAKKEDFRQAFEEGRNILVSLASPQKLDGGWRIDKEADDEEEWVIFSGWDSVEQHMNFGQTHGDEIMGYPWYGRIQDSLDGIELRHLRKLET